MAKIKVVPLKVSYAKTLYDIIKNPNFIYLRIPLKNVEAEIDYIIKSKEKRKKNISHEYAISYNGKIVGGCGIKIDQHRKHIGEIGYFVAEEYWGKGIATKAVNQLEKICFKELKISRIEIWMNPKNKGSEKVAIKCGYKKEGLMRKAIKEHDGKYQDALLYAKVK